MQHSLETSAHHNDKSAARSCPVTDVHSFSDGDFVMWSVESTVNLSPDISQSILTAPDSVSELFIFRFFRLLSFYPFWVTENV